MQTFQNIKAELGCFDTGCEWHPEVVFVFYHGTSDSTLCVQIILYNAVCPDLEITSEPLNLKGAGMKMTAIVNNTTPSTDKIRTKLSHSIFHEFNSI